MTLSFNLSLPIAREAKGNECRTPEEAAREFHEIAASAQECFCVLTLNTKYKVIDRHLVSIGTLDACLVHPREVFRAAVLDSAAALVLVHNHPSGDPTPSREDLKLTRLMIDAGRVMNIEILDHIIIGRPNAHNAAGYLSIRESGMVAFTTT